MLHVYPATMRKGDLPGKTETNARATWFSAKKRYKYLINGPWRNTAAVICDGDTDLPIVEPRATYPNTWVWGLRDRVDCVVEKIEQGVLEQFRVRANNQINRIDPTRVCNVLICQRRGHQPLDVVDDLGQLNGSQYRVRKVRESPITFHELHQAKTASLDRLYRFDNLPRRLGRSISAAVRSTA
jgi:hypothetical protein